MTNRELVKSLKAKIFDYRKDEISGIDVDHITAWVRQFDKDVRDPILSEVKHVLDSTYLGKDSVQTFLAGLASHKQLTSGEPKKFWKNATVLDIQRAGSSQSEMLEVFDGILEHEIGFGVGGCAKDSETAVYIDDVVFSGGHVRGDLVPWIEEAAPKKVELHIIVLAYHTGGQYFANEKLKEAAKKVGKSVNIHWWRIRELEDRKYYINNSDVLRPVRISDDDAVKEYAAELAKQGYPPVLRKPGQSGPANLFSSEDGRDLLEQQLLIKGAHIRQICPYLNEYQRPLGNSVLRTLGFGSLIVTFRNCANNCPLALWAGDPWIPLFPRKTN